MLYIMLLDAFRMSIISPIGWCVVVFHPFSLNVNIDSWASSVARPLREVQFNGTSSAKTF